MSSGRRLIVLVLVCGLVALPALALRAACAGRTCDTAQSEAVPFCSLPASTRSQIAAGFRQGRSPDVMGVARVPIVSAGTVPWPTVGADTRVPVGFLGAGVDPTATIPAGRTLDAVAPTAAEILGLDRPHPDVRSGTAIPGVADGARPKLLVLVSWGEVGSADLEADSGASRDFAQLFEGGVASSDTRVGSIPTDPAAVATTIGTGALPFEHGITGGVVRAGVRAVPAWSASAPESVVATLADDLDESRGGTPRVAFVGDRLQDRGLVGDGWYLDADRDDVLVGGDPVRDVTRLIAGGYGTDDVPDVIGVAMRSPADEAVRSTARIWETLPASIRRSAALVVAGTGPAAAPGWTSVDDGEIARRVERDLGSGTVAAVTTGGVYLSPRALEAAGRTSSDAVASLRAIRVGDRSAFADAFPAFAVDFSRYC